MRTRAQELLDEELKEQVLRGIDFLNEMYGPTWVDHIDPSSLMLDSIHSCVLGQLYKEEGARNGDSGYSYAVKEFAGDINNIDWPRKRGFQTDNSYEKLTEAWQIVLA